MTTLERPRTDDTRLHGLQDARLRAWSGIMLGALLVQVLLGAANVSWLDVPEDGDAAEAAPQWLLQTHIWFGTAIVVAAVVVLVLAIRSHDAGWILIASVGLVAVVLALAAGDRFLRTHGDEAASMAMACGAVLALASYAVGTARRRRTP